MSLYYDGFKLSGQAAILPPRGDGQGTRPFLRNNFYVKVQYDDNKRDG